MWTSRVLMLFFVVLFMLGCNEKPQTDVVALPKVELHQHLDCSLSFEVVQKLNPAIGYDDFRRDFVAPARCTDLADYITRAVKAVDLMQTEEQLRLVTLDVMEQLRKDHVIYAELRFAPLQHLQKGLTAEQVVRVVNDAVEEGIRLTGVQAGVILCTLRHYSRLQSMETVMLAERFKGTHIVGFDIAADEAGFPIDNHVSAFNYAHEKEVPCTAHAGEASGAGSVWETLQHLRPSRIGHGVRSMEDASLIAYLKKRGIHLEVCPTSNVQTAIYDGIADHAVDKLYRSGVSMSINTDARTISDVSLGSEYELLAKVFGWEKTHFLRCNLEAIEHAFTSEDNKRLLKEKLIAGYK